MLSIRVGRSSFSVGALALAIVALGANTATAGSVVIQEVYVFDFAKPIAIYGEGFGTDPEVTLGTKGVLERDVLSSTLIVASLPYDIEVGGQYLLLVTVPPTASSADAGCDAGKPMALTFQYTGGSCDDSDNDQERKFECSGDPEGAGPVGIRITKDAAKTEVIPSDKSIEVGESVTFIATGKRLKSKTQFDVVQDGSVLQSLNIHTSCSKPITASPIRDVFGSMTLTGFFPEGTDESELRPSSDEFDMVVLFVEEVAPH